MYSVNFNERELYEAEDLAHHAAQNVATMLAENFGKTAFTAKSDEQDWVTKWDKLAEEQIAEYLSGFSRDIGFVGEETGVSGNNDVYWTIDPIDGTSGFVRGIDECTTMISLVDSSRPVVAEINDFVHGVSYSGIAVGGVGARTERVQRLKVSTRQIEQAHIETYVQLDSEEGSAINQRIRAMGAFIRNTGAAGHTFTSIASGSTEGFVSYDNPYASVWDYAPGALLVHLAGGEVRNIGSDTYSVDNPDFIASNPMVFNDLHQAVLVQR